LGDGGGVNDDMHPDDAEQARREGYARMAVGAAEAHATPGLDDDDRNAFWHYWELFAKSAGLLPTALRGRRSRRAGRLLRLVAAVSALVLAGAAWTIAGDRLNPPPHRPPPKTELWKPSFDPQIAQARMRDPNGTVLWGLRSWLNDSDQRCIRLGRIVNGRLGKLIRHRFQEMKAGADPKCLPRGEATVVYAEDFGLATGARSVAYGVAGRDVHIRVGRRPPGQEVPVAGDGTFLYVAAGLKSLDGINAYIVEPDGSVRAQQLTAR
jgi:hypothetical protein